MQEQKKQLSLSNTEMIIRVLSLAEELGRTPTAIEFRQHPGMAPLTTVLDRFGTWNKFLKAAGLETNYNTSDGTVTNEELISQVRMLAEELGRPPSERQFYTDPRIKKSRAVEYRYGTWNKFLEAAGLETNTSHGKKQEFSDEELISQIQTMAKELGRTPTIPEYSKSPKTACSFTAIRRFGSWSKFLKLAGLKAHGYSDEELLVQVRMLAEELGKPPTQLDFSDDPRTASAMTAVNRFGSWNKFLEKAGLKPNKVIKGY